MKAGNNGGKIVGFKYGYSVPVIFVPGRLVFYLFHIPVDVYHNIRGVNYPVPFGAI
jgi:hypothetical protein